MEGMATGRHCCEWGRATADGGTERQGRDWGEGGLDRTGWDRGGPELAGLEGARVPDHGPPIRTDDWRRSLLVKGGLCTCSLLAVSDRRAQVAGSH